MHKRLHDRTIGVEIEYSNLSLNHSAKVIQECFGGKIIQNSRYDFEVVDTKIGNFSLELDAQLLKKLAVDPTFAKVSQFFGEHDALSDLIEKTAITLVPYEVVCPPVAMDRLDLIDNLVNRLRLAGALGTTHAFQYAFGVHLNIQPPSFETKTILRIFQSFLILQPWLERQTEVDITRKFSPFIESFDKEYLEYVLQDSYKPNKEHLIKDYITFNPSRNRVLDMLPLFAYFDSDLVRSYLPKEKINPRPTYHYRLPNSKIDLFHWNLADELHLWQCVELLSKDDAAFFELKKHFLHYIGNFFSSKDEYVQKCHQCITDLLSQ